MGQCVRVSLIIISPVESKHLTEVCTDSHHFKQQVWLNTQLLSDFNLLLSDISLIEKDLLWHGVDSTTSAGVAMFSCYRACVCWTIGW